MTFWLGRANIGRNFNTMIYNWNIIGHEKQLKMLEGDIASGNLAHAYLLCGPSHVGKYTVAKKLAHTLQCPNNFCGKCATCTQVRKGSHIDTMEYPNNRESIKIELVRGVVARSTMSGQSAYKAVLLQSIERMTPEAANCFLKTLEEPPAKTVFIMTTSHVREILPTIVSRSRIMRFHLFSIEYLTKVLREQFPDSDPEEIDNVAKLSLGKTGKALDLMNEPDKLAYNLKLYKDVLYLLDTDNIVERFRYVEGLMEDDRKRRDFLNVMLHVLRNKLLVDGSDRFIRLISNVENAKSFLKQNVNTRLVLENLMFMN